MRLPWDSDGTLMGLPWVAPWEFRGTSLPMVLPWDPHGTPMEVPWESHGAPMGLPWDVPWGFGVSRYYHDTSEKDV